MDASQTFTTTSIPGADQIGQGYDTAKLAYQNTLTKLNQQRQSLARQSGYNVQFDPTSGQITSLGVDASNPYGQYQQTLRGAALNDRAARFGAEERGLHGGLAHQAEAQSRYGNQVDLTNLSSNVLGQFNDMAGQQRDAATTYNNNLYEQEQQAARDAIIQGLFNQTNYDGIQYDPYGDNSLTDDTSGGGGGTNPSVTPPATYNPAAKYVNAATAYQKKVAAKKAPAVYIHSPGTETATVNKAINTAKPKPASPTKKPKAV